MTNTLKINYPGRACKSLLSAETLVTISSEQIVIYVKKMQPHPRNCDQLSERCDDIKTQKKNIKGREKYTIYDVTSFFFFV